MDHHHHHHLDEDHDDHEEDMDHDHELPPPPTHHHHHQDKTSNSMRFRYRECLKNHAVGLGGHALDGCGEFMPGGADGSIDALRCAACSCHRNFHRKEDRHVFLRAPAGFLHVAAAAQQQRFLALPSPSDEPSSGRKRHRTKFTTEQKEKMVEFAERVGWRIQKHDEDVVNAFCHDMGVKRHVLKVWMHNNKHTLGKLP